MSTKALFPCEGGSNLILGTGTENQIFILRTPATIKFFHQILKNDTLVWIKNHYPLRWICIAHIWSPTLFPRRIIIFQGVLTKFNFLTKFPHLEKIGESGTREKMAFKDDLCQMCKNNHYLFYKYLHGLNNYI